jgi:hypothetical protein
VYILPFCVGAVIEYAVYNSKTTSKIVIGLEIEDNEYLIMKIIGSQVHSFPFDLTDTIQDKYSILSEKKMQIEVLEDNYKISFPLIDEK